ncbi:hypothetical protein DWB77_07176 [Streptomyces hundungensis]|uniref:Uncharacterized protein n=1 Tax=Streptomyces hundungensis TaxID=1077946 RepID=A0A387HPS5_9ACTN|nr:hypothetical protein DWB77_07176 [Streptomyces hundungensis]
MTHRTRRPPLHTQTDGARPQYPPPQARPPVDWVGAFGLGRDEGWSGDIDVVVTAFGRPIGVQQRFTGIVVAADDSVGLPKR